MTVLQCALAATVSLLVPQRDIAPVVHPVRVDPAAAVRFLDRATFGASNEDVIFVTRFGYEAWIDAQFAVPPTLKLPAMIQLGCAPDQPGQSFATCPNYDAIPHLGLLAQEWWNDALHAPDQLRQRVAFALSEIFVVSDLNGTVQNFPSTLSDYYDTLVRGAFSNYRQLLEEVTLHPSMGGYLSMAKNRQADLTLGTRPDENFAREVMQLFSIGLAELNADGSQQLDAWFQPIPTYDQNTITETARALTGWNYDGVAPSGSLLDFLLNYPRIGMMIAWSAFHDTGPKAIVGGSLLPPGWTAEADLGGVLDALSQHPNVGPFLGKQLIQRLVTSNPSPAYVGRIAEVWADDGSGARGNLEAVVRAILLDPEALEGYATRPLTFGKLREPILKLTGLWRKFRATGEVVLTPYLADEFFGQRAMGSPSVFNFFSPFHASPALQAQGLVSPELQIATHSKVTRTANALTFFIVSGNTDLPDPAFSEPLLDLGPLRQRASDPASLVAYLDLRVLGGTMSPETRILLEAHLATVPHLVPGLPDGFLRAVEALALLVISPDYALQS
ncbi:hypothetical protein Poly30_03050 [Planctomycetes bacterium Poly30]|uniref:DUF1800 domain-containing protein n=1 Tax=Saltatorellus ferox TaxID=2528018 RepID=A0A518EL52_9BACT|nr:hypothetical protein Poly30_03050 [Planctomycetes bacterium Poly30]